MAEQMMQHIADELAAKQAIPAGYKQTEVGVIPEDWSVESLSQVAQITRGKFSARPRNDPKFFGGDIPFIQTGDITRSNGYDVNFSQTINELGLSVSKLFPADSLFFTIAANIGDVAIAKYPAACPDSLVVIKENGHINKRWLYHILSSKKEIFESIATSNAQLNINLEKLNPYVLGVPELEEQTAIANVLSDSDALIGTLEQLIAKKQAIKTATMQQLLTGRTRLPQFALRPDGTSKGYKTSELGQIPEDWKVVCLGDIGQSLIGLTYSPKDVSDDGVLVLRSSNVQNGRLAYEDAVFVQMDLPDRVMVKEGDILICVRNGSRQLIGKCALIDKSAQGFAFGAFMSVYRTEAHGFVFYQFQSDIIQSQINETMGATINQITNRDMARFKIMMPKSIEEQTAIATILTDMDSELTALEQKLAKARDVKQGMMQQLLTGRIRLPLSKEA